MAPKPPVKRRSARGATWVSAGILVSRLTGLIRESVFAGFFGASPLADAWKAALRLPNVLQTLLGEGSLSASFVPVYSEMLEEKDPEDARHFAAAALGLLAVAAGVLALLGVLTAPWIVAVLTAGFDAETQALTTRLLRILFPMTGILVLAAWALGVLNSHRTFFVPYVAPAFWNLIIIGTLVVAGLSMSGIDLLVAMAWGALAGGVLQFVVQLPWVFKKAGAVVPSLDRHARGMNEAVRNLAPVVGARGLDSISGLVREVTLASFLAQGAVTVLAYAQTLYVLPISLFGLAVAAAELPEMSRSRKAPVEAMARRVRAGLERVQFFVVPAGVGYAVLGRDVIRIIFERGQFTTFDAIATHAVLAAFSLGLLATSSSRMLSSAYYGLRDTATPARLAAYRILMSLSIGVVLMVPFDRLVVGDRHLGAVGLALGSSAAAWTEYLYLRRGLAKRIGTHGPGAPIGIRIWCAAILSAVAGLLMRGMLGGAPPLVSAFGALAGFGAAYLGITHAMKVDGPLRSALG